MKNAIPGITYKAKRANTNIWIYGTHITQDYDMEGQNILLYNGWEHIGKVNPNTICRSFGYKTTDVEIIYDKDIIQFTTHAGMKYNCIIQWNEEGQEWQPIPCGDVTDLGLYYCNFKKEWDYGDFIVMMQNCYGDFESIKVLGNCFDNPELIYINDRE